jgi:uncharacterized protein YukE
VDDGFVVHPPQLRDCSGQLQQVAEHLDGEWTRFRAGVQARGDIFGDDAVGGLIGATYQAAQQLIDGCYASAAKAFAGFGTGLSRMADGYEQTDQDHADMFHRLSW